MKFVLIMMLPILIVKIQLRVLFQGTKFFDKQTGSGPSLNEDLAEEFYISFIKKFKKRKMYAKCKGNIWKADLPEIGSSSSKD